MDAFMDFSGLHFRIWGCFPFFLIGGLFVLAFGLLYERKGKESKLTWITTTFIGSLIILLSLSYLTYYIHAINKPQISMIEGTLVSITRNSHVAPPLPVTTEYTFDVDGEHYNISLYLDSFSKKQILDDELMINHEYTIWYSEKGNIIVRICDGNT